MSANNMPVKTPERISRETEALLLTICSELFGLLGETTDLQIMLTKLESPEANWVEGQLGAINQKLEKFTKDVRQMAEEFHQLGYPAE